MTTKKRKTDIEDDSMSAKENMTDSKSPQNAVLGVEFEEAPLGIEEEEAVKKKATVKKGTESFDVVENTQEDQIKAATAEEAAAKAKADEEAKAEAEALDAAILAGDVELPETEVSALPYQALKNGFKYNYKYVAGLSEVKEALTEDGFYNGPIDSKVTQEVIQAFADFQSSAGREATGIPGVVDLQELGFKVIT